MICVTGDTHGDHRRLIQLGHHMCQEGQPGDSLLICGDAGLLFTGDREETRFLDDLSNAPFNLLFVDGNHENFRLINRFPVEMWNGGHVHRIRQNVVHLMRGQVFTVEGRSIFTMGGAYSIDRDKRVRDVSYWEEEMPCPEEYRDAWRQLVNHQMKVDYVVTHTAPTSLIGNMGYEVNPWEKPLNDFLEKVWKETAYHQWFFGHWHVDGPVDAKAKAVFKERHWI